MKAEVPNAYLVPASPNDKGPEDDRDRATR